MTTSPFSFLEGSLAAAITLSVAAAFMWRAGVFAVRVNLPPLRRDARRATAAAIFSAGLVWVLLLGALGGFQSYDGVVEEKWDSLRGRLRPIVSHHLRIGGRPYQVERNLFLAAIPGRPARQDRMRPWASIDGRRLWRENLLWNLGFWSASLLILLVGVLGLVWWDIPKGGNASRS